MYLSPEDKGYIAGIIDGEGCLYFNKRKSNSGRSADPVLNISNTDFRLLDRVLSIIGGGIYFSKAQKEGWKPQGHLIVRTRILKKLLPQVVDLLTAKREQAILVMKWIELFGDRRRRTFAHKRKEVQAIFVRYSKLLNQKGIRKEGELRETLSNETILSQAFREIEEKVQRLTAEAKDLAKISILKRIKEGNMRNGEPITYRSLYLRVGPYDKTVLREAINELLNSGVINIDIADGYIRYVYAGNADTSALGNNDGVTHAPIYCHDIVCSA